MRMAYFCVLGVSVNFSGAGAAAPASVAVSHQSPCPDNHRVQIELRNLAPVGQIGDPDRNARALARSIGAPFGLRTSRTA